MTKVYSISIDSELMKKADDMAKKQFIPSRSAFIGLAVKYYIRYLKRVNNN